MWAWIQHLDRLLRGEATSLPQLQRGRLDIPILGLCVVITILGMIYGACMGLFAVTGSGSGAAMQIPASMIKLPLLFFLTLIVTLPSLYVFNALVGSRLNFIEVIRLLIGSLAVMLAVLSSLGPIVAFFSVSSTSYQFMLLLNVIVCALSGFLGLSFLLQTLHRMTYARNWIEPPPAPAEPVQPPEATDLTGSPPPLPHEAGALDAMQQEHVLGPHVRTIFRIWVIVFGLVGSQMSWVLRPFVGQPGRPFEWFRPKESNFFEGVWHLFTSMFG
jgi:hypothetical protein